MDTEKIDNLHNFLSKPSVGRRSGRTYKMLLNAVHETDFSEEVLVLCHPEACDFLIQMANDIAVDLNHNQIHLSSRKIKLDNGSIFFKSHNNDKIRGLNIPTYKDHYGLENERLG